MIVLCHGFPELWYSWRYQLPALSSAGYHAVAVDIAVDNTQGTTEAGTLDVRLSLAAPQKQTWREVGYGPTGLSLLPNNPVHYLQSALGQGRHRDDYIGGESIIGGI